MIDIDNEIKVAMKDQLKQRLSLLRAMKTAFVNEQTSKNRKTRDELSIDEQYAVIRKMIAQRKDSFEIYCKQGAMAAAGLEAQEIAMLEKFLPRQLSKDELEVVADQAISAMKPTSMKDMGRLIAFTNESTAGSADPKILSQILSQKLKNLLNP